VTRLEAFLHALAAMVMPAKGRHHPARTAPAPVSDDTAPFPAITRTHPYSQEPTA
jgi:hypothetical protein